MEGEQEWLHFCDPWDLGDLWISKDTSLEHEVFLAVVESGHLGVDVVELRWVLSFLLVWVVSLDSTGTSEAVTFSGDSLVASGPLAWWYEGAGRGGISA